MVVTGVAIAATALMVAKAFAMVAIADHCKSCCNGFGKLFRTVSNF